MLNTIPLSEAEIKRYQRHLVIPEFGNAGQENLKAAKVLVIGCGGLGSPVLLYLAAAGVGTIGIVDFDVIEESNLQRQVLFTCDDLGKPKAEIAKKRLLALNPHISIHSYVTQFNRTNAREIIREYDVVADGTDNFPTRYLVNDACVLEGKVNVYASIYRFEGQVSVFNYLDAEGNRGPNYRHLFPEPPPPGLVPSCAEGGVLGVLPGIIGAMQASEVIKVLTGVGEPLSGRIFLFDAASFQTRILNVSQQHSIEIKELIDYDFFCSMHAPVEGRMPEEIDVSTFQQKLRNNHAFYLLDVREQFEVEITNIGAHWIPLAQLTEQLDQLPQNQEIIIHCKSGVRSMKAAKTLLQAGFTQVVNLKGGILAMADAGILGAKRY